MVYYPSVEDLAGVGVCQKQMDPKAIPASRVGEPRERRRRCI